MLARSSDTLSEVAAVGGVHGDHSRIHSGTRRPRPPAALVPVMVARAGGDTHLPADGAPAARPRPAAALGRPDRRVPMTWCDGCGWRLNGSDTLAHRQCVRAASRYIDARDIATGRMTAAEVQRENAVFAFWAATIDLDGAELLS